MLPRNLTVDPRSTINLIGSLAIFNKYGCWRSHSYRIQNWKRGVSKNHQRSIGQPTHYTHPHLMEPFEVTPGVSRAEYKERRSNLLRVIANTPCGKTNGRHIVIITGSSVKLMTADIPYPFHQSTEFLYFLGLQEPDAVLLLETKDGLPLPQHNMMLFLKQHDSSRELWDGPSAGLDAAVNHFGASQAFPITSFIPFLREKFGDGTYCIWYDRAQNQLLSSIQTHLENLFFNDSRFKYKALHSLGHYAQMLRLIKSSSEINLLKKAASIGAHAFRKVMRSTKPLVKESILHALFEYESKCKGAQRLAFPPVVAGGDAANTLHYVNNSQLLRDGDLVLMDAGCEYNGYACDITRTWPVNGKFSEAQRELYEIVLRVQDHIIKHSQVGVSLDELHHKMLIMLGSELQDFGFIEKNLTMTLLKKGEPLVPSSEDSARNKWQIWKDLGIKMESYHPCYKTVVEELPLQRMETSRYCPHHLGHYLGMDTHDTPLVSRRLPLQAGMVITVEPGLYIPKHAVDVPDRYRGIGIRIEDDVLVSQTGPLVLTHTCPKTVKDIEALLV